MYVHKLYCTHAVGHEFDFTNTKVIRTVTDYYRRLILVGIEKEFTEKLVNLQAVLMVDECWMPFLNKLYKVSRTNKTGMINMRIYTVGL